MRKIAMIMALGAVVLTGCYEEAEMTVTPSEPEYDLSDSQTDPVQHQRYLMYRDYGVILIDDVEPSDYIYNMTAVSSIRITKSQLSQADKLRAIELVKSLIFDAFPKEHTDRFPVKCILGASVAERNPTTGELLPMQSHLARAYFAFAITKKVLDDPDAARELASSVLSEFVLKGVLEKKYGEDYLDLFAQMFFSEDERQNGVYVSFGNTNPGMIPGTELPITPADYPYEDFGKITDMKTYAYGLGVPALVWDDYIVNNGPGKQWPEAYVRLKSRYYLPEFLAWALLTSDEEQERVLATYEPFAKRYAVIRQLLKEYVDIDISEL